MGRSRVRSRTNPVAAHLALAFLGCASLTIDARARASYDDGSAVTVAAVRTPPARSSGAEPRGAVNPIQAGTAQAGGSKSRGTADISASEGSSTPHRKARRSMRGQAERLQPGPSALARGPAARASTRIGSSNATTGNRVAGSLRAAGPARPALPPLRAAAPGLNVMRSSAVGRSHAVDGARLGGPAIGRTSSTAFLDGAQMHRK